MFKCQYNKLGMSTMQNLSLRIENVSPYVDAEFIKKIIELFHFGSVKKVFIREHIHFEPHKQKRTAFVYFDNWYETSYNRIRQSRLLNQTDDGIIIHYDSSNQLELYLWKQEPLEPSLYKSLHDESISPYFV